MVHHDVKILQNFISVFLNDNNDFSCDGFLGGCVCAVGVGVNVGCQDSEGVSNLIPGGM